MRTRQWISVGLTAVTFIIMVTTIGLQLPPEHGYHGGWIWGLAWFPLCLVITMRVVVEGQQDTKLFPWFASIGLSYGLLIVAILVQDKSWSVLLTQVGWMEASALALGYLLAIAWVGFAHRKPGADWFFPQLFGVGLLLITLIVVGQTLWQTGLISWWDLPGLLAATAVRSWPVTLALRKALV